MPSYSLTYATLIRRSLWQLWIFSIGDPHHGITVEPVVSMTSEHTNFALYMVKVECGTCKLKFCTLWLCWTTAIYSFLFLFLLLWSNLVIISRQAALPQGTTFLKNKTPTKNRKKPLFKDLCLLRYAAATTKWQNYASAHIHTLNPTPKV